MNKLKILLINPKFPPSYWGQEYSEFLTGYNYVFPPLGLATVASLSKPHDVTIIDENTHNIDYNTIENYDIVGLTGYMIQSEREFEICTKLKEKGAFVVIGGPNAYLIQEQCEEYCDVLIKGEAELIWPEFLTDFQKGRYKKLYEEKGKVDMRISPKPRFDLLDLEHYVSAIVQTTRGCPFTCDFCDIIVIYGRKVREKAISQVIEEVDDLRKIKKYNIFFADDNFIGNKRYAKKLLEALIEYNNKHGNILSFYTQVSVNLAHDEKLLELMYKARFQKVFIGIETPRKASLLSSGKTQNLKYSLIDDIRKIQSYNILIMAGMIVGFDNDDKDIFKEQVDFLQEAGIPYAMVGTLQAVPHTPLYKRLLKEDRIISNSSGDNFSTANFIPKLMTIPQLMDGYVWLTRKLYSISNFKKRMNNNIEAFKLKDIPITSSTTRVKWQDLKVFIKTLLFTAVRFRYLIAFIKMSITVFKKAPNYFPQVVGFYIGFVHISRYLKKHRPNKKEIISMSKQIAKIKETLELQKTVDANMSSTNNLATTLANNLISIK